MRDVIVKTWLVALMALVPCIANAAGLGRLTVLSALGQPLNAEVELLSVAKDELAMLNARLASPDAYRQANLQYNQVLPGARLSVEKRPDGQLYIRITSSRPVNEPFIDLLIELTWSSGRLVREYTALLDPPSVAPAPPAPAVSAAPEARPAPAPQPPVTTAVTRPITTAPMAGSKEYGPIQRGETLGKIAKSVLPEGVTLEQMLVALYRSNVDAFIRKNLNLMRTGKILRVPDKDELAAIPQREAVKEYRTHVADWNAYRQKLADAAGAVPAEGRSAVSGRITTKVEDKAGGEPKDVVKLSKGEPPGAAAGAGKGKPRSNAERIRMLEEEVVARERALNEANERVAQLEKTIKDMQKLVELKSPGMAAAQQQALQAAKPKVVAPPPPQPDLIDQAMEVVSDPLYLAAGGGVIVLGGLAFWMVRRRRAQEEADDTPPRSAPTLGTVAAAAAGTAAVTPVGAAATPTQTAAAATPSDEVDPLAEAEVYIAYGRDGQAEEILKEALARKPKREDVQLKLLEIYAARKDQAAFGKLAGDFQKLTGGTGDGWLKVAAMGYALDRGNALYEAGKGAQAAAPAPRGPITGTDLDLDLGLGRRVGTSTDIMLDAGAVRQATQTAMLDSTRREAEEAPAGPLMPDFTLDVPSPARGGSKPDIALDSAAPAQDSNMIDFQIELPKTEVPAADDQRTVVNRAPGGGLDFKLDMGDIDLNLGDKPKADTAAVSGEKDVHWYDVQTKFDLAKAYQEMGDKDGAKEILQEVLKEGDAEQKAQAKLLLNNLG